jgi:hypothetical protein
MYLSVLYCKSNDQNPTVYPHLDRQREPNPLTVWSYCTSVPYTPVTVGEEGYYSKTCARVHINPSSGVRRAGVASSNWVGSLPVLATSFNICHVIQCSPPTSFDVRKIIQCSPWHSPPLTRPSKCAPHPLCGRPVLPPKANQHTDRCH